MYTKLPEQQFQAFSDRPFMGDMDELDDIIVVSCVLYMLCDLCAHAQYVLCFVWVLSAWCF